MSYLAFARRYRPQAFKELVGQDPIATTLRNAIRQDRVTHAYLFAGPRGVGKTSVARIFAKSLNCETGPTEEPCNRCIACQEITQGNSLDVLEIDGASNRGIDQIRELRENVKFRPARGKFRIYIIDEVHQITHDGFDALLKTLEEPPPHVKFILATTEPHKVPPTIVSRCQRFDFRRIPSPVIAEKLKGIVEKEKVEVKEETLLAIARASQGSMRDAESLLDQLACGPEGRVELKEVFELLGWVGQDVLLKVAEAIQKREKLLLLQRVDELVNGGQDLVQFVDELMTHFRNLAIAKLGREGRLLMEVSEETAEAIYRQAEGFSLEEDLYILNLLSKTRLAMKRATLARIPLEITLVKLAKRDTMASLDELVERLESLEKRLGPGKNELSAERKTLMPEKDPSVDSIGEKWDAFVQEISAKKKMIGTFLGEGKPSSLKEGVLTVAFLEKHRFHRETLETQQNRKLIEDVSSEYFGRKITFAFETLKDDAPPPPSKEQSHDPIVKFTLDVLNGNVVKE